MGFEKGNRMGLGRPKGAINSRKRHLDELAIRLDVDPMEILLRFAKGDWEGLGYESKTRIKYSGETRWEEDIISTGDRIQAAKESAQYMYAKLKTIEVVKENQFEGMTLNEKIEAMKHALAVAEKLLTTQSK